MCQRENCHLLTSRLENEPSFTLTCFGCRPSHIPKAFIIPTTKGHVVSLTTRALARLQSLPDNYVLPDSKSLAITLIGNGVPSLMGLRIFDSFGD